MIVKKLAGVAYFELAEDEYEEAKKGKVVNEFDIVPNLMTGFWLLWPYTHFGNEYRVYDSRTGNYIEHPKSQKLHSFFKQLFKEKVTDHHMDHYIRNLNL